MGTVTVELKPETVDEIVLQELTSYLRYNEAEVRKLQLKATTDRGLRDYERQNLADAEDAIAALKIVRRLYQCPSDWD